LPHSAIRGGDLADESVPVASVRFAMFPTRYVGVELEMAST